MAIYHYHAGFVSRSTGRSAVQSAAYISGVSLHESRRDITADYRNCSTHVIFTETLAPEHAPAYMRTLQVWDALDLYEDTYASLRYRTSATQEKHRSCAQIAQTGEEALPKELKPEVWKELVVDFAKERFVSRELVVTIGIHNDKGNPHAHFQVSRRSVTEQGEWSWAKDRIIVTKSSLFETRKLWAEKVNFYLEREGFEQRVDHRSYADLRLLFEPTQHEGWYAHKLENMGHRSRIIKENTEIKERNKEALVLQPEAILRELTSKQATFSALELSRIIQHRLNDDPKLASYIYEASLSQAVLVGMSLDGQPRYTSQDYLQLEHQALNDVQDLMGRESRLSINTNSKDTLLKNDYPHLNSEQRQAVEMLFQNGLCHVLVGRAGTGKTTTLKAVVELHQQAGFNVVGLSLSATAADNLGRESGCSAETIAFYLDKWKRLEEATQDFWSIHPSSEHYGIEKRLEALKPYALKDKTLVLVDEAGMVGTAQWQAILEQVQKVGAKLIAVGDDHQFKAIEAGDFFRKLKEQALEKNALCELKQILRQKEGWMKQASEDLAELKTYQALSDYEQRGHIKNYDGSNLRDIALSYLQRRHENPEQSSLLLASTRIQCQSLNDEIRDLLKNQGLLSHDEIQINGRAFAIGDNIVFLKNDRDKKIDCFNPETGRNKDFLVKNGTYGKIVDIQEFKPQSNGKTSEQILSSIYKLTVDIDKDTSARFLVNHYSHIDHGYGVTLHKAQGQTVDWSMIIASPYMDAYATYVALTRHRHDVTLFYDAKTFGDFKGLQRSLSRVSNKDLSIDYTITPEHQGVWENVQEYKLLGQDLTAMAREQNWQAFNALKTERNALGQTILSDWHAHWHYVRQAGLTKETIEIACGLKARPLSLAEQDAHLRIQNYAKKAFEARTLWREIRHTHPGKHCYDHPSYEAFTKARQERNLFAAEIINNRPLHREFIQQLGRDLGIGWKVLQSQARQDTEFTINKMRNKVEKEKNGSPSPFYQSYIPYQQAFVRIEADQIKQELNQRISLLAKDLLGEPQHRTGREWRYGNKGSTAICIAGAKQGLYADFETGSYGGALKLIQDKLNIDHKAAYKWAIAWLSHDGIVDKQSENKPKVYRSMLDQKSWVPTFPIPEQSQGSAQIKQCLEYQLNKYDRREVARYAYKDAMSNLLGYTVRLEDKQGNKVVLPLTYCQSPNGNHRQWRWQGFGDDRSLYGLDRLATFKDKPVLVVEGEKTADAAQRLLHDYVVISWAGGAGAHPKTDWKPLLGRTITLWPDNDEAGLKAMAKIETQLETLHQKQNLGAKTFTVKLPHDTPSKWDLADPLPKGWTEKTIASLLNVEQTLSSSHNHILGQNILQKYRLEKPRQLSYTAFIEQTKGIYKQMLKWHQFLGHSPSTDERKYLFEKAVLATALQPEAKQEYCFLSTPLEAKLRSEGIALVTAGLIQEQNKEAFSRKVFLKEGARLYNNQSIKQPDDLIKNYQKLYPEASGYQLEVLAGQQILCWNMIKMDLPQSTQQTLLSFAKTFELLQQEGKIAQHAQKVLDLPTSFATKENEKIINKMLEKQFMHVSQESKSSNTKLDELNFDKLLENSAHAIINLQTELLQQRKISATIQERSLLQKYEQEL